MYRGPESLLLSLSHGESRRSFPWEFRVDDLCWRVAAFVPRRLEHCAHNFNITAVQETSLPVVVARAQDVFVAAENSILISPIALGIPRYTRRSTAITSTVDDIARIVSEYPLLAEHSAGTGLSRGRH